MDARDLRRNGADRRGSRCLRPDLTEGLRKNLTGGRAGQVKRETRYDYAAAVAMRYQRSSREQKGWILDEFCAATGYHRKHHRESGTSSARTGATPADASALLSRA